MTTTDPSQEPPGPAPASACSAEFDDPDGGGRRSAPASGRTLPDRGGLAHASAAWAPWALRAAAGVITVLALAGIGTASLARGSDGVPFQEASSLLSGGTDRWLAALIPLSPAAPSRPRAPTGPAHAETEQGASSTDAGAAAPSPSPPSDDSPDSGAGITPDGKVVLNLATAEQLTRLPGVGAKRAEAIVQLRTRLKRFRRATDLLRVRGIGQKTLRRMLPHLVVDAPAAAPASDGGAPSEAGK